MRKWECTVCGYIHEGDEPPEECPICGAGKEYFIEIVEKQEESLTEVTTDGGAAAASSTPSAGKEPTGLTALILKHHLHPISVHTPNGVLPLAILFLFLATAFGMAGFEKAAFFNLVFVLLTMPVVIITGVMEWRNRYKGVMTRIFGIKIGASVVVTTTLLAMVIWRLVDPGVAASASRWVYLFVGVVMVGAVGLAGHMGGKLVFDTRDR